MKCGLCARALATAGVVALSHGAWGFEPTAPVEVVVHAGPGSGVDLLARVIASASDKEKLQKSAFRVTPKTGGNGAVAMSYLAEKAGSPHTIGVFTTVWIGTPLTMAEAKVSLKDLKPIAILVTDPALAVVKNTSPFRNMNDFIEAARKAPAKMLQAGGSSTSVDNLTRLLVQKATGTNWTLIPFPSGGERLSSLLGEHAQIIFMQPQEVAEGIRAGQLRAVASITEKRLAAYPNVPTLAEQGIPITIPQQVRGVVAPPGLPKDVLDYWQNFFARLSGTASWKSYVEENQLEPHPLYGAELDRFLDGNISMLRVLLKEAGANVVR